MYINNDIYCPPFRRLPDSMCSVHADYYMEACHCHIMAILFYGYDIYIYVSIYIYNLINKFQNKLRIFNQI